jgi:geranylgeranyl pyrophosphate synthase
MQIYHSALELLLQSQAARQWPLLRTAIERAGQRAPVAWDFPVIACRAVGAGEDLAIPAVAAITCAHMALLLIDDLLDDDPRGEQHAIGVGRAANLAAGLSSLGLVVLAESAKPQATRAAAALNKMMGSTARGQELDVQNIHSETSYWAVTRAKSSPYFATALSIGAMLGGADAYVIERLHEFGSVFGEIMQIHDDLNDCLASPANVDWLQGRAPLPILFAELAPHPQRQRFLDLRSQVADLEKLHEAQAILVSSGAISYCANELLLRQQAAEKIL